MFQIVAAKKCLGSFAIVRINAAGEKDGVGDLIDGGLVGRRT